MSFGIIEDRYLREIRGDFLEEMVFKLCFVGWGFWLFR